MTIWTPLWAQGGTYLAQTDRTAFANLWDEGVADRLAFKVVQRGAGANMSVDVAVGVCVVQGDDQAYQGNYVVRSDSVFNLTGFTAPVSNSRYDIVGLQINDPNAGGAAGSNAVITRVVGTAAASPVIPTIPASFLPLAIIGPILTSTTSIPNSMIHDAHTGTGPTGVTGIRRLQGFRDAPGTTKETYNAVPPNGWLIEDGTAISRTTYAALFEHFGTTFGVGDGSSTFNLPDSRGRVLVALDNQGANGDAGRLAAANALGGTGGEELHTLSIAELPVHHHAGTVHSHGVDPPATGVEANTPVSGLGIVYSDPGFHMPSLIGGAGMATTTSIGSKVDIAPFTTDVNGGANGGDTGSGTAHNVMQPYILGYRIVRT